VIQRTQERLEVNSKIETSKTRVNDIDFDCKPNFLIDSRKSHFESMGMFSEVSLPVPFGLKVKETREERSLQKYQEYQQEWN
jgi:hypothetical protein